MFDKINEMKSYLDDMAVYSKKDGRAVAYVDVDYLHALLVDIENDVKDCFRKKDDSDLTDSIERFCIRQASEKIADGLERLASESFGIASKYAPSQSKSYFEGEGRGIHLAAVYALREIERVL